jgi:hypothetical protein
MSLPSDRFLVGPKESYARAGTMVGSDRIKDHPAVGKAPSQLRECDVTAARQLHLFRGRKQCGIAPPVASEYQLHCAVADTVRR